MTFALADLLATFPSDGEVCWIGLRPGRNETIISVRQVFADVESGLHGDRCKGGGKRQVTLMQWEHLLVLSSLLDRPVHPEMLRRNLLIKGINLLALKGRSLRVGGAELRVTGLCQPCSKMEKILGEGGYNAMRGHGGITATIIRSGIIRVGDALQVIMPKNGNDLQG